MIKLSRETSHELVKELILAFGGNRVQRILSVDDARLRVLAKGRGCVSYEQLEMVERQTGRAWLLWLIDSGARIVTTAQGRELVANARKMWSHLPGSENLSATRASIRRPRPSPQRRQSARPIKQSA